MLRVYLYIYLVSLFNFISTFVGYLNAKRHPSRRIAVILYSLQLGGG